MEKELENEMNKMFVCIDAIYSRLRVVEEMLDTILHSVCKSNDEKTMGAIRAYLGSEFRNRRNSL